MLSSAVHFFFRPRWHFALRASLLDFVCYFFSSFVVVLLLLHIFVLSFILAFMRINNAHNDTMQCVASSLKDQSLSSECVWFWMFWFPQRSCMHMKLFISSNEGLRCYSEFLPLFLSLSFSLFHTFGLLFCQPDMPSYIFSFSFHFICMKPIEHSNDMSNAHIYNVFVCLCVFCAAISTNDAIELVLEFQRLSHLFVDFLVQLTKSLFMCTWSECISFISQFKRQTLAISELPHNLKVHALTERGRVKEREKQNWKNTKQIGAQWQAAERQKKRRKNGSFALCKVWRKKLLQ